MLNVRHTGDHSSPGNELSMSSSRRGKLLQLLKAVATLVQGLLALRAQNEELKV